MGLNQINRLNTATCLFLSQATTYICNFIRVVVTMFNDLRRAVIVRFVDIGDNGDHQNLNCFYHTLIRKTKNENQRIYYDISEP